MVLKEMIKETERILDTIDIVSYMRHDDTLEQLMIRLESAYAKVGKIQEPPFEGYLFNWMGVEEFNDYLKARYNNQFISTEVIMRPYSISEKLKIKKIP